MKTEKKDYQMKKIKIRNFGEKFLIFSSKRYNVARHKEKYLVHYFKKLRNY